MNNTSETATDERVRQTIVASAVFEQSLDAIAHACADAWDGEIVAAVVTPDLKFSGVWVISTQDLHLQFSQPAADHWILLFSPQESPERIRTRCQDLAHQARAQLQAMNRRR